MAVGLVGVTYGSFITVTVMTFPYTHILLTHNIIIVKVDDLSHDMRKPVFGVFQPGPTQTGLYSHRRWVKV